MASNRNLLIKLGIAAAVVIVGIYLLSVALRPQARVAKVSPGKAIDAVPGSVTVRAEYAMPLKNEIGGRVVKSELDEGKVVKEGDFLLQLDPADIQLKIEQIESNLKAAKARLEIGPMSATDLEGAKADLQNAERQFKLGSISESELQKQQRSVTAFQKKVQLENAELRQDVETLENSLKTEHRSLDKTTMVALFDGKISEVFARKGDLIGPSTPIATIISTSRTVEARISEENFSGLKIGQKALVSFLGYGSERYDATVAKILPTADPETQRYVVHLDVKIDPAKLVPGVTGDASITVGERDSQTMVPRRAVFGNNVYVVKDGRVEPRKVELGYVGLNTVEILKGVQPGELVIVEELDRFHAGDRVRTVLVAK